MNVLLTGGLGFIGSHCAVELIQQNYQVIIIDNLSNSSITVLENIQSITNVKPIFYNYDLTNEVQINEVFNNHSIDTVINLVGYKAVGESVMNPLKYYDNNINSLLVLLKSMNKYQVNNLIFSSSATVYGHPETLPLTEDSRLNVLNPYGQTKLMSELILKDCQKAYDMNITILRYFNPVGAHPSGLLGENPTSIATNLFPVIIDCYKHHKALQIFGSDYETKDGTGVRDYIHVCDLAVGHVKAIKNIKNLKIYNLGTGQGYSVLDIVNGFKKHIDIIYEFKDRRPGDSAIVYANPQKANDELGWTTQYDLDDMIQHTIKYHQLK